MARMLGTRFIPSKNEEYVAEVLCDVCRRGGGSTNWHEGVEWSQKAWDAEEVTLARRTGSHYPEGDFSKRRWFEICHECYDSKIVPFLESLGAVQYERDSEP